MRARRWRQPRPASAILPAVLAALLAIPPGASFAQETVLGRFSAGDLFGWKHERFAGQTVYRQTEDPGGGTVLEAVSNGTTSGLVLERKIDLTETPTLIWRWRVQRPVNPPDERTRAGNGFAARIYFVTPGKGLLSFPDSVAYVWAGRQLEGSSWPNPYTGKVRMVAVDSGTRHAGEWRAHRRNMRGDFRSLFGRDITEITHIAIMTDTDNSQLSAHSWYGDIRVAPAGPADR